MVQLCFNNFLQKQYACWFKSPLCQKSILFVIKLDLLFSSCGIAVCLLQLWIISNFIKQNTLFAFTSRVHINSPVLWLCHTVVTPNWITLLLLYTPALHKLCVCDWFDRGSCDSVEQVSEDQDIYFTGDYLAHTEVRSSPVNRLKRIVQKHTIRTWIIIYKIQLV